MWLAPKRVGWVCRPEMPLPQASFGIEVHEILGQCRGLFVVSNIVTRLPVLCFASKIFAINFAVKLQSHQNT